MTSSGVIDGVATDSQPETEALHDESIDQQSDEETSTLRIHNFDDSFSTPASRRQSINQQMNQSIDQTIEQPDNQSISEMVDELAMNRPSPRSPNQSIKESNNQSNNQSIKEEETKIQFQEPDRSSSQPIHRAVKTVETPMSITITDPESRSINQPINQPVKSALKPSNNQSNKPQSRAKSVFVAAHVDHDSVDQSVTQSVDSSQPFNQSKVAQEYIGLINRLIVPLTKRSINQSSNQSINQSYTTGLLLVANDLLGQVKQTINQTHTNQTTRPRHSSMPDRDDDQSINQANNQSNNQSIFSFTGAEELDMGGVYHTGNQSSSQLREREFSVNQSVNQSVNPSTHHRYNPSISLNPRESMARFEMINQSINQTTSQSNNQSNSPIVDIQVMITSKPSKIPSGYRSINRTINPAIYQAIDRAVNPTNSQSVSAVLGKRVHILYRTLEDIESINQSNNQTIDQSTNQSTNQSSRPSISQSTNQSVKPITAIAVIFKDLYEEVPYGFDLIDRSLDGRSANLNQTMNSSINQTIKPSSSQSSSQRHIYLAVYRGDGPAINQLGMINQPKKRSSDQSINQSNNQSNNQSMPSGYHVVKQTPFNHTADLQASNQSTSQQFFLTFNLSINQSINHTYQPLMVKCQDTMAICQSINQTTEQLLDQSIDQSLMSPSATHSINQSINQSISIQLAALLTACYYSGDFELVNTALNVSRLFVINQSINQPINQSINQSINQELINLLVQSICNATPVWVTSVNQSINQTALMTLVSIYQSINQSNKQAIVQSIEGSNNQSTDHLTDQSINQSINLSINTVLKIFEACLLMRHDDKICLASTRIIQTINQPFSSSNNQTTGRPTASSANQTVYRSVSQSHICPCMIRGPVFPNKSFIQTATQSTDQSINQSNDTPVNQSNNQSDNQSPKCFNCRWKRCLSCWTPDQHCEAIVNQSVNQSIKINQSISLKKLIDRCKSTGPTFYQSINQSIKLLVSMDQMDDEIFDKYPAPDQPVDQSINQSINQSVKHFNQTNQKHLYAIILLCCKIITENAPFNHSISQSVSQSNKKSETIKRKVHGLMLLFDCLSINQSVNQFGSSNQLLIQDWLSECQSVNQSINRWFEQSNNQSNDQAATQFLSQPINPLTSSRAGILLLRRFICPSLLVACVSDSPAVFRSILSINQHLFDRSIDCLIVELGVFIDSILLNLIDPSVNRTNNQPTSQPASQTNNQSNNQPISVAQKKDILDCLMYFVCTPSRSVNLFYQYDNQSVSQSINQSITQNKLFERLVNVLARICENETINQSINQSEDVDSESLDPSVSQLSQQDDIVRVKSIKLIVSLIHHQAQWLGVPYVTRPAGLTDQSISQLINKAINQSNNQPSNEDAHNQSLDQSINQLNIRTIQVGQSTNLQSAYQPSNPTSPVSRTLPTIMISPPTNERSIIRSTNQLYNESMDQSMDQSLNPVAPGSPSASPVAPPSPSNNQSMNLDQALSINQKLMSNAIKQSTWLNRFDQSVKYDQSVNQALKIARNQGLKKALIYIKNQSINQSNDQSKEKSAGVNQQEVDHNTLVEMAKFMYNQSINQSISQHEVGEILSSEADDLLSRAQYDQLRSVYQSTNFDYSFNQAINQLNNQSGDQSNSASGGGSGNQSINHHFLACLRSWLTEGGFRTPGEAQKIDRLLDCFAKAYVRDNPGVFAVNQPGEQSIDQSNEQPVDQPIEQPVSPTNEKEKKKKKAKKQSAEADSAFILAFAVVMLNTDLHNQSINPGSQSINQSIKKLFSQTKGRTQMTEEQFISNLRGVNQSMDFDRGMLSSIYQSIKQSEIKWKADQTNNPVKSSSQSLQSVKQSSVRTILESFVRKGCTSLKNQSFSQSINQSLKQTNSHLIVSGMFSVSWLRMLAALSVIVESINQSIIQTIDQSTKRLNQSNSQASSQAINQAIKQSINQSSIELLHVCVDGLVDGSMISIALGLSMEQQAFTRILAKLTFVNQCINQANKSSADQMNNQSNNQSSENIRAALVKGDHLNQEWYVQLQSIINQSNSQSGSQSSSQEFDQSDSLSITQSTNELFNETINPSTAQSILKSCQLLIHVNQSIKQSINASNHQSIVKDLAASFDQSINLSINQSNTQSNRTRCLIKQGQLIKLSMKQSVNQSIHQAIKQKQTYQFFLFTDLLIYAESINQSNNQSTNQSNKQYKFHRALHLSLCRLEDIQPEQSNKQNNTQSPDQAMYLFRVVSPQKTIILQASTQVIKQSWMEALNHAIKLQYMKRNIYINQANKSPNSQPVVTNQSIAPLSHQPLKSPIKRPTHRSTSSEMNFSPRNLQSINESINQSTVESGASSPLPASYDEQSLNQSIDVSLGQPMEPLDLMTEASSPRSSNQSTSDLFRRYSTFIGNDPSNNQSANQSTAQSAMKTKQQLIKEKAARSKTMTFKSINLSKNQSLSETGNQSLDQSTNQSSYCKLCLRGFTLFRRKVHCSFCLEPICSDCNNQTITQSVNQSDSESNESVNQSMKKVCDSCVGFLSGMISEKQPVKRVVYEKFD